MIGATDLGRWRGADWGAGAVPIGALARGDLPWTPRTYLDHAATTPVLPEVVAAMSAAMSLTGNASSLHTSGRAARRRVEESRETIAAALGARPSEVLFTSGGTESDNLAVAGIFRARRAADHSRRRIIVSALEHHAVLDMVDFLVANGIDAKTQDSEHLTA